MSTTHPSPVGLTRSAPHGTRSPETAGTITAEIVGYHPSATTGLGEPAETAHVRLTYESDCGEYSTSAHAQVVAVAPKLRRFDPAEPKTWVREAWANEADADGELVRSSHGHTQLFQFSTEGDLRWGKLLEEVVNNAQNVI